MKNNTEYSKKLGSACMRSLEFPWACMISNDSKIQTLKYSKITLIIKAYSKEA